MDPKTLTISAFQQHISAKYEKVDREAPPAIEIRGDRG